jgi:hypothetical protein
MRPGTAPPYIWFKLFNEWMQVEILDELVKCLDHSSSWYRIPFMGFMATYFTVFQKQCNIIEKIGFIAAYESFPFLLVDLVHHQLKLLAIPMYTVPMATMTTKRSWSRML